MIHNKVSYGLGKLLLRPKSFRETYFLAICLVLITSFTACSSQKNVAKDFVYFQTGTDTVFGKEKETIIQPNDLLGIQVFSKTINQEQAAIFNIPNSAGTASQGYQVTNNGNIEMPVIGGVRAAGLTKDQFQKSLVEKLTNYVKNPTVVVRFLQFNINVLGEVRTPGTQKFSVDKVSIIDAISAAGDLTDFGKRENITIIREQEGKKLYYTIDLRSKNLFESPVYFLQPNDIVYVSPNTLKLKNLNVDPEAQRKSGLFLAITSVVVSIASLLIISR